MWYLERRNSIALMSLFLFGCAEQTSIQRSYVSNRNECQLFAEENIGRFVDPAAGADERSLNAKLVTLFSDCMFDKGWTVATPEREEDIQQPADEVAFGSTDPRDLPNFSARRAPSQQQPGAGSVPNSGRNTAPQGYYQSPAATQPYGGGSYQSGPSSSTPSATGGLYGTSNQSNTQSPY